MFYFISKWNSKIYNQNFGLSKLFQFSAKLKQVQTKLRTMGAPSFEQLLDNSMRNLPSI